MVVAIRVDSNSTIGTGHVSRCTNIAAALEKQNHKVHFVCDTSEGNKNESLRAQGYSVEEITVDTSAQKKYQSREFYLHYDWKTDVDQTLRKLNAIKPSLIIVDNYSLDHRFHSQLRSNFKSKIVCLDDLANRQLDCDLLIDQNLYLEKKDRYKNLTPQGCEVKVGLQYNNVLLNPGFINARRLVSPRTGANKWTLVFLGGADFQNVTSKVVEAIAPIKEIKFFVVLGTANKRGQELQTKFASHSNLVFKTNVDMAEAISNCDLAIGCSGVSGWERAFLGLPTLLTNISDNQNETGAVLTAAGAAEYFGTYPDNKIDEITKRIPIILNESSTLKRMSKAGMSLWSDEDIEGPNQLILAINKLVD